MTSETLSLFFRITAREDRGCLFTDPSSSVQNFVTYTQMYKKAEDIAEQLLSVLQRRRFVAAIWMEPSPLCLQAFMAVVLAGGIRVPIHPNLKDEEVGDILRKVEVDAIMLSPLRLSRFRSFTSNGMSLRSLLPFHCLFNGETGQILEGVPNMEPSPSERGRRYTPPEETAVIIMSSGSTGKPKGVMLSNRNLLSNVDSIQDYLKLTEDDHVLISKSFGYSSTITGEWLTALKAGAHLQMTPGFFHPFQTVRFIRDYQTTCMCTVPSALVPLAKSVKWQPGDLSSLKKLVIVGGAMAPEMLLKLKTLLPWTQIMVGYGLTEASPRVTFLPDHRLTGKADSVGIPVSQVEVKIYREGEPAGNGEVGEIIVCGPNVMLGYYDDKERTASALAGYGLRTLDMGYMDEEGYLYISGRLDNALNVAGHTLYPETIEKVILASPLVQEAAVIGMSDEVWGQRPVAFVVPTDHDESEENLINELFLRCRELLGGVRSPKEIFLVRQLPKTNTGKLDRPGLQSIVKEMNYAGRT